MVSTCGIGDVDALLSEGQVGILVSGVTTDAYEDAANDAFRLARDPATRDRCRGVAREQLSLQDVGIPRYDRLYRRVAAGGLDQ